MSNYHNPIGICLVCILLFSCFLVASSNYAAAQQTTPSDQTGILWSTNIPWNLANTPARGMQDSEIGHKYRGWTTPVLANSVLYASTTSEVQGIGNGKFMGDIHRWINVYAFNAADGEQIWSFQANFYQVTDLAVSDGKVVFGARADDNYLGDTESTLYALNADNGDVLWKAKCPYVSGVPVVDDGAVLVASLYSLRAFNLTNGNLMWTFTPGDLVFSTPAADNGAVFISSNDHTLYAVNATDGAKMWSIVNDDLGFSSATAANGVVYVPSDDGNVYARNATTSAEIWRKSTTELDWANTTSHSIPLYDNGVLYLTSNSRQQIYNDSKDYMCNVFSIVAIDADSGHKLWNYTTSDFGFDSSGSVADGVLYTQGSSSIAGFNIQNGALIWNYTNPYYWPQTRPEAVNGVLYVGFSDGQVYAIDLTEAGIHIVDDAALGSDATSIALYVAIVIALFIVAAVLVFRFRAKRSN